MTTKLRSLLALFVALALLLGQQAAWTHLVSHLGEQGEQVSASNDDAHEAADALSHVCVACLAFVGLDAGPISTLHVADLGGVLARQVASVLPLQGEILSRSFLARAPPSSSEVI